jgi:ribosome recycling factor
MASGDGGSGPDDFQQSPRRAQKEARRPVIDDTLLEAEEKMERAVEHAKEEFGAIRTGRANPGMFSKVIIDYYGTPTPLTQMASVAIPEPRMAIIKPYDNSQINAMEKAIRDSDLGVNPNNEGNQLRILLPQMTEERRRDMIKVVRHKGEEAKVAIRNIRRRGKEELDRIVKDGEAGEDEGRRAEKELDDLTQRYVAGVDDLVKHKETELLEV